MNLQKWLSHEFSSSSEPQPDYLQFQRELKLLLRQQAEAMEYKVINAIQGHYEFSIIIQNSLTMRIFYIGISDVRFFKNRWHSRILWREMKNARDYIGHHNNFSPLSTLMADIKNYEEKA